MVYTNMLMDFWPNQCSRSFSNYPFDSRVQGFELGQMSKRFSNLEMEYIATIDYIDYIDGLYRLYITTTDGSLL